MYVSVQARWWVGYHVPLAMSQRPHMIAHVIIPLRVLNNFIEQPLLLQIIIRWVGLG